MNQTQPMKKDLNPLFTKIVIRFLLLFLFLGLITLLPAGTFRYPEFYLYLAVLVVPMIFVVLYFIRHDPDFLDRRMRTREKEKTQIRVVIFFSFFFIAGYMISGFDRRFGWSNVPFTAALITDAVILAGYIWIFFVFKQNSFASRVVEVDAGQKVISTGLYSVVRHPMYLGMLFMYIPTPIALGSYWGLAPMAAIVIALILRILNEEEVLKKDLPGYVEYCEKTKYRLIPFFW